LLFSPHIACLFTLLTQNRRTIYIAFMRHLQELRELKEEEEEDKVRNNRLAKAEQSDQVT